MEAVKIILQSIVLAVIYGVIHDQITARICIEYFTIGHPVIIPTVDPTMLGLVWGVIATWWAGALIGIAMSIAARVGSAPKWTAAQLRKPLIKLLLAIAVFATLGGLIGWVAASNGWVFLVGHLTKSVPVEAHTAFLTALWIHNASYLAGFVGGLGLAIQTWRRRHREAKVTGE